MDTLTVVLEQIMLFHT